MSKKKCDSCDKPAKWCGFCEECCCGSYEDSPDAPRKDWSDAVDDAWENHKP